MEVTAVNASEISKISADDPRVRSNSQERRTVPTTPPRDFRRIGKRDRTWQLSRTLSGYVARDGSGVGGKATKWVLSSETNPDDFYIVKFGNKNGRVEVITEFFNNQLGDRLGFNMAHSGLARLDGELYFVTKNFREGEDLVHGSLMIEEVFGAKKATEEITPKYEQAFYSIEFIKDVVDEFCGVEAPRVFQGFVDMLIFDSLIGSMDRHSQNWGVLKTQMPDTNGAFRFRFSPIFDSARALLWDLPEGRLVLYDQSPEEVRRYTERSKPCIGPHRSHPKVNKCNHFAFVESLLERYPHQTLQAYKRIPIDLEPRVRVLLCDFPFDRVLSSLRRRCILKVLTLRADRLNRIFQRGGASNV